MIEPKNFEKALGNESLVHVAVKHGGAADSLKFNLDRYRNYLLEESD